MSVLKICRYGDPVLRQKSKPVEEISADTRKLVGDMLETLYAAPGVGLAAVQVGVPLRVVVIDIRPEGKRQPLVLINPKITGQKGKMEDEEGCLSLPGYNTLVKRPRYVRVEAVNDKGFPIVIEGEDLLSRALQHEIDHLDGKLFIDKLSIWTRKKIEMDIKKKRKKGEW